MPTRSRTDFYDLQSEEIVGLAHGNNIDEAADLIIIGPEEFLALIKVFERWIVLWKEGFKLSLKAKSLIQIGSCLKRHSVCLP